MTDKKEKADLKNKPIKKGSYDEYTNFISNLAQIAENTQLNEIEFKENDVHIKIRKDKEVVVTTQNISSQSAPAIPVTNLNSPNISSQTQAQAPSQENIAIEQDYSKHSGAVLSPMVGIAYTSPNPESEDFVKEGSKVKEGDTVLLIEAMKVFNAIKAHKSGTVVKVLVSANDTVEFNQPLIIIE